MSAGRMIEVFVLITADNTGDYNTEVHATRESAEKSLIDYVNRLGADEGAEPIADYDDAETAAFESYNVRAEIAGPLAIVNMIGAA
jgi:hypothetical protein